MASLFLLDVFGTGNIGKIILRCLMNLLALSVFAVVWVVCYSFNVVNEPLCYVVCVIAILFQSFEKKELSWYSQIYRSTLRKHLTLLVQCICSLVGQITLSWGVISIFYLPANSIFAGGFLLFLYSNFLIYRGLRIVSKKILWLVVFLHILCAYFLSDTVLSVACISSFVLVVLQKKKCFFDPQESLIGYSFLSSRLSRTPLLRSVALELTFLFRVRKITFVSALLFPLVIQGVLIWYGIEKDSLTFQLFYSFATGGSAALLGSYLISWLSFYFDDVRSKQVSVKHLVSAHYVLFQFLICCNTFFAAVLFIYFKMSAIRLWIFLFLNLTFTTYSAMFLGLVGLTKTPGNKTPLQTTDSGNMIAAYLPYLSCVMNVMVYSLLRGWMSDGSLLTVSICLFLVSLLVFPYYQPYCEKMCFKMNQKKRLNHD